MPKLKHRPLPILSEQHRQRFWKKVEIRNDQDCWFWKASTISSGCGNFKISGTNWLSSRLALFLEAGVDPLDLCVLHSCDNRGCCNPKHLTLGTQRENIEQRDARSIAWDKYNRRRGGSNSWSAKLTWEHVSEIRQQYARGESSTVKLARKFGVNKSTIREVVRYLSWKLPGDSHPGPI